MSEVATTQPSYRGRRWTSALLGIVVLVALIPAAPAAAYRRPSSTKKVDVTKEGVHGKDPAWRPAVSGNGRYVTFTTRSNNLGPQDENNLDDVYVLDRATGDFELVSVASDGSPGKSYSTVPAISSDGRFVAFQSKSWNFAGLAGGNFLTPLQVYLHDRETGETILVSRPHDGAGVIGNGTSLRVVISGDGRYVGFESDATNLVAGDSNGKRDVFLFDRTTNAVELVSVASDGRQGTHHAYDPAVSFDGRFVGFRSGLENQDQTRNFQVFLRDRLTGKTEMVSVNNRGERSSRGSAGPQISADGRYVAFESAATNLVPNDNNDNFNYSPFPNFDIYVRDRVLNTTERVSVNSSGAEGDSWSQSPRMTPDGRFIVFDSRSSNLSPQHTDGSFQLYVHDRVTGVTEHVSVADDGTRVPLTAASAPTISDDGSIIAYVTDSSFDPQDDNLYDDSYVRDRGVPLGINTLERAQGDGVISYSGSATFSGSVLSRGDDSATDGDAAAEELGAQLTGADVRYRVEDESLRLRWLITDLHETRHGLWDEKQPESAGRPDIVYGARFTVGGVTYEARAARYVTTGGAPLPQPFFGLFRCDPACALVTRLDGGLGSTGQEVVTAFPLGQVGSPGDEIGEVRFFSARGDAVIGGGQVLDEVSIAGSEIPISRVEAGVAPAGSPQSAVEFGSSEVSMGAFKGSVDTSALEPGHYDMWVRACLASDCSARSFPFEVEGDPDVDPTPTPTVDPDPGTAAVTLSPSRRTAGYRKAFVLNGSVVKDEACLQAGGVSIEKRLAGTTEWRTIARDVGAEGGAFSVEHRSSRTAAYRATVAETPSCGSAASDPVRVGVRALIAIRRNSRCVVAGRVYPRHPATRTRLQKRVKGQWRHVASAVVSDTSHFRLETRRCRGRFRIVWSGGSPSNVRTVKNFRFRRP